MKSWSQLSDAAPEDAWSLIARPDQWSRWAPHVRGAWGLGDPEVEEGRKGFARLLGFAPVPARITQVTPGTSWSWQVGPITLHHLVERFGPGGRSGSRLTIAIEAAEPIERMAAQTYGRVLPFLLRRLARQAECERA